ncbi:hypothetical protein [Acaryochloris marina]|uniref:Uncharacterized protein n=1 Tax=Acaryochloris marina (strain MBIC 11017) TaxID=329726 RepID=A8ZNJ0_ACAM1|nr:hypothetical protein [Acaryochloris marina]ABW32576.1 hypothetical protein AM1_D0081 [Acaryochloris marina MBIC11017]
MFALIGLGDIVGRFVSFFAKNRSSNLTRKVASFSYLFGCSIVVIFYFSNLKSENLSRNIFFKAVNIILSLIPSIILTLRTGRVEPLYTWILIIPRVIGMYAGSTQAYEQAS